MPERPDPERQHSVDHEQARNRPDTGSPVSRRNFIQSAMLAATAAAVPLAHTQPNTRANVSPTPPKEALFAPPQPVNLRINGKSYELSLEPRTTLLDALREVIGLTGTKKGCDRGQCGACTVLVDGRRINSCLTLAIMQEGKEITTIEGLARADALHPMQEAFLDHDAFQCGYCTPGQICSATAMLEEVRAGAASAVTPDMRKGSTALTDAEIRERMSGNICRCGAYPNIVAAIRVVADKKT
jgi:xanthine dehydrogenase YagT iron-sulfur-binding subunit